MDDSFLDFIWQQESSKGKNPDKGTTGDYQIKRIAYKDAIRFDPQIKKWSYKEVTKDPQKGRYVANVLFSKAYPHYIKAYGLPDNNDTRIAMWNWGVGNVKKVKGDVTKLPDTTKRYIKRYHTLLTKK